MAELFTGIRPVYTFADKGLFQYEKIAARKLGDVLEQLELGEGANLQLNTVRFQPDDIATISIRVMGGILSPIILVDIDRQVSDKAKDEEEPEFERPEEEVRWYYSPSIWFGVVSKNHTQNAVGNNENCDLWGYPPSARIWAFEPLDDSGADFEGNQYGYGNTVESLPGHDLAVCGIPVWSFGKEGQAGVDEDRYFEIFNDVTPGFGFDIGQEAVDLGWFGWQDWKLLEGIVRSKSGMTTFEGPGCYQTTPRDALVPLGQAGQLLDLFEDDAYLPQNYWERSVIVAPSFNFIDADPNVDPDDPVVVQHVFPALRFGDLPGDASVGVTFDIEFPQGDIFNTVLSGEYEFNLFAMQFACECIDADISARLVLGQRITELENDEVVDYRAIIQIVDFDFPNIGDWKTSQAVLCRDHTLGGHGLCDEFQDRGMLDSNGRGIAQDAIYVNPMAATWHVAQASFRQPFFDDGPAGSDCPQDTTDLADDPLCQNCSFVTYMDQTGFGWANGGYNCLHSSQGGGGAGSVADTRDGLSFHLARVVGVEAPSNRICHVQMVGNDGGDGASGSPCGNDPLGVYSYGHVFFATGIDPSIPIGTDLLSSGLPNLNDAQFGTPGEIGGWQLHELVVVVGFAFTTGPCAIGNCNKSFGERLLVSKLNAGGEDFRLLYWSQVRCASGIGFRNFIEDMEEQSQIVDQCAGEKQLTYQNFTESGITYGGFAPTT
jgi:hypothetical protein